MYKYNQILALYVFFTKLFEIMISIIYYNDQWRHIGLVRVTLLNFENEIFQIILSLCEYNVTEIRGSWYRQISINKENL